VLAPVAGLVVSAGLVLAPVVGFVVSVAAGLVVSLGFMESLVFSPVAGLVVSVVAGFVVSVVAGVVVSVAAGVVVSVLLLQAVKPVAKDKLAITSKVFQFIKFFLTLNFLNHLLRFRYYSSTLITKIQGKLNTGNRIILLSSYRGNRTIAPTA
jgi:hypothetical protein